MASRFGDREAMVRAVMAALHQPEASRTSIQASEATIPSPFPALVDLHHRAIVTGSMQLHAGERATLN